MTDTNHEKNKAIIDELHKADPDKLMEIYLKWSDSYDEDLLGMQKSYTHPTKIAQKVAQLLPEKARILDVCAGTGLGGVALRRFGFVNVDAIDGSPAMLKKARAKGVYCDLYEEFIGIDAVKSVEQGSYDAVVTSGSFLPGHLGPRHLGPLAGVIRSGGFFVMAMRESFIREDEMKDLEPEMIRMEEEGVWKRISWELMEHYYNDLVGKVFVYQKL